MADGNVTFGLNCIPCEAKDINSGRCRMAPKVMETVGVIINSPVRIKTDSGFVFCSAWPRNDENEYVIQYDRLVSLEVNGGMQNDGSFFCQNTISYEHIRVLNPVHAKTVTVSLCFSSPVEDCEQNMTKVAKEAKREKIARRILRNCTVVQGCCIKPKECRNSSWRGTVKIVVNSTEPSTQSSTGDPSVTIDDRTRVFIKSAKRGCVSKDESSDVLAGLDETARMLCQILSYPFLYPESFAYLGLDCPKGILLQGAPGVGKTLLVKSVTLLCDAQLITVNGTDVFGPHPGESEENLRQAFQVARNASQHGPCVLFIDEIDALCPKRSSSSNEEENRLVAQLLTLLDGLEPRGQVVVIGATNRPNAIDPALRRPGRFDREVVIDIPSGAQRLSILKAHTRSLNLHDDVNLAYLAEVTLGYVGADLASLCREAAFMALKRYFTQTYKDTSGTFSMKPKVEENNGKVTMADFQLAMCHIVPSTYRNLDGIVDLHPVSWEDIGGLQDVKQALIQAIEWPFKHPDAFDRLGLKRPRGVLLYGPPGCCKTTLVRAAATSCRCTFMALSCAQLYSPYVGDAERKIREIFTKAHATAPSILFLDELDAVVGKRSGMSSTGVEARLLSTLLNEMDGVGVSANIYHSQGSQTTQAAVTFKERDADQDLNGALMKNNDEPVDGENEQSSTSTQSLKDLSAQTTKDVLFVAATNRPGAIDEALLRPGRIDRLIYVPPPDMDARLQILKVHTRASPLAEDVDLEEIALTTERFSGADLENLCREAALYALEDGGMSVDKVNKKHFAAALTTVKPSLTKSQLEECKLLLRGGE